MSKRECRAKEPHRCPYHGREAYKYAVDDLNKWVEAVPRSGNLAQYENIQAHIKAYQLRVDSTTKGLKLLQKEFNKAVKSGDFETQMLLAGRLKADSEHLAKMDGKTDEYEQATEEAGMFGYTTLVLQKGAKNTVVETPTGNGTQWFTAIADRIAQEDGFEVTSLNLRFEGEDDNWEEGEQEEIRERLLRTANAGELSNWLEDQHGLKRSERHETTKDYLTYIQGLTYIDPAGREITVQPKKVSIL